MTLASPTTCATIRVLVVDDSAAARQLLCRELAKHPGIEVVGTAVDPYVAREQIVALRPDVLTLDIQMPRMDGITFLRRLMKHHPLPVVVISALGKTGSELAIEALSAGAIDVVCKPSAGGLKEFSESLADKIRTASKARIRSHTGDDIVTHSQQASPSTDAIFVLGASTGGVQAITEVVSKLPADIPPLLIVQHMPAGFTASFAQRLDGLCKPSVKEAVEGDALVRGQVLIAPGGRHMILRRRGNGFIVGLNDEADVCHQRPSIDVLFNSVAQLAGPKTVGVLLTGMGTDGAEGLLQLRRAGAQTIAQDEQTSTVFGMPAEAVRLGAAQSVLPLQRIAQTMMNLVTANRASGETPWAKKY